MHLYTNDPSGNGGWGNAMPVSKPLNLQPWTVFVKCGIQRQTWTPQKRKTKQQLQLGSTLCHPRPTWGIQGSLQNEGRVWGLAFQVYDLGLPGLRAPVFRLKV